MDNVIPLFKNKSQVSDIIDDIVSDGAKELVVMYEDHNGVIKCQWTGCKDMYSYLGHLRMFEEHLINAIRGTYERY